MAINLNRLFLHICRILWVISPRVEIFQHSFEYVEITCHTRYDRKSERANVLTRKGSESRLNSVRAYDTHEPNHTVE